MPSRGSFHRIFETPCPANHLLASKAQASVAVVAAVSQLLDAKTEFIHNTLIQLGKYQSTKPEIQENAPGFIGDLSTEVQILFNILNKTILSFDFLHQELMPHVTAFLQTKLLCECAPSKPPEFLGNKCNHTTNFAVLMEFHIKYKYENLLDYISYIGVGLSMAGLVIIICFQILTRKTPNLSVKWMLASLCFSVLVCNIIFISEIESQISRKCSKDTTRCYQQYLPYDATSTTTSDRVDTPTDSWCTLVAVLLHYFLLAAFLWSALSSALLYLLLLRGTKPLPGCFLVTITISIVVVLEITWMIGYLMLIKNEKTILLSAFSFVF
ncbi:LOW QUALITY PROTEIN: adhesion G-protein coupled receptor G7 [Geothlypis trichas]